MRLVDVADEIISILAGDPNAMLNITLEINAEFPSGASPDQACRERERHEPRIQNEILGISEVNQLFFAFIVL